MTALIANLIRRFHGQMYETPDSVLGFFDDPVQAKQCAAEIESVVRHKVELCGCQVNITGEEQLQRVRNAGY